MELSKLGVDDVNMAQSENSKENIIEIEIPYPLFQYLSSAECNLQNICRICLSMNDPVLFPLFSAKEQCVLANMIMAISEVQVSFATSNFILLNKYLTETVNFFWY